MVQLECIEHFDLAGQHGNGGSFRCFGRGRFFFNLLRCFDRRLLMADGFIAASATIHNIRQRWFIVIGGSRWSWRRCGPIHRHDAIDKVVFTILIEVQCGEWVWRGLPLLWPFVWSFLIFRILSRLNDDEWRIIAAGRCVFHLLLLLLLLFAVAFSAGLLWHNRCRVVDRLAGIGRGCLRWIDRHRHRIIDVDRLCGAVEYQRPSFQ